MRNRNESTVVRRVVLSLLSALVTGAFLCSTAMRSSADMQAEVYPITIDATALVPESWWQVPGRTPSIWTADPETSEAHLTSRPRVLPLPPGQFKFVSFTFDFAFEVTREGTVDYATSLDQCVEGRGTAVLRVRCKRTYPHGGHPDY